MSSLSDLVKVMQVLLNPRRPESIVSPFTVREWLRPMHSWFDDYSEVGALWEIYSSRDSYGKKQKLYQKSEYKLSRLRMGVSVVDAVHSRRTSRLSYSVHARPQ